MKNILFLLISFCCYPALSQDLRLSKPCKKHKLKITLNVPDHVLPPSGQWKYDLDIWQYPVGSLFQFYPGPRSSIRFEKIIEGVQASEKIRHLPASQMVESAKSKINKF
jgi:hypothetical protein